MGRRQTPPAAQVAGAGHRGKAVRVTATSPARSPEHESSGAFRVTAAQGSAPASAGRVPKNGHKKKGAGQARAQPAPNPYLLYLPAP